MFPYAAVNVAANKAANQNLSDHAYRTLQALIDYADELGICWPGIRLLVNDTRKCKEMVQQGLEELEATGCIAFVRRNARDKYTGQKLRHEPLASPEEVILTFLETNPSIRNSVARKLCHVNADYTMKAIFQRLVERGLIEKVPGTNTSATAYQKGPAFANWRNNLSTKKSKE